MQEIKFRGKSLVTGEWLCGSLINNAFFLSNDGSPIPYILDTDKIEYDSFEDIAEYLDEFEVLSETVGQYTGLKDKNGKEIYEGDILLFHNNHPNAKITDWKCVVKYREGSFVCEYPRDGVYNHFDSWNVPKVTWEIIGNIYESPELLRSLTRSAISMWC